MSDLKAPIPAEWLGTIRQMPYSEYSALDAINAHGLMNVLKSPGHYQDTLKAPHAPPSPSMLSGILLEMALLEPDRYAREVVVGGARMADPGQTAITQGHSEKIQAMLKAVRANSHARDVLANVDVQPVVLWTDAKHDVPCKARLDAIAKLPGGQKIAIDIKTARGASIADFSRAAAQFRYDLQAAHYLEAGRVTGGYDADTFLFVVVQNCAPFCCFVYEMGAQMAARGRAWREHAMSLYSDCRTADQWPGEPAFQTLELPRWAPWPEEPKDSADVSEDGLSDPPDID